MDLFVDSIHSRTHIPDITINTAYQLVQVYIFASDLPVDDVLAYCTARAITDPQVYIDSLKQVIKLPTYINYEFVAAMYQYIISTVDVKYIQTLVANIIDSPSAYPLLKIIYPTAFTLDHHYQRVVYLTLNAYTFTLRQLLQVQYRYLLYVVNAYYRQQVPSIFMPHTDAYDVNDYIDVIEFAYDDRLLEAKAMYLVVTDDNNVRLLKPGHKYYVKGDVLHIYPLYISTLMVTITS